MNTRLPTDTELDTTSTFYPAQKPLQNIPVIASRKATYELTEVPLIRNENLSLGVIARVVDLLETDLRRILSRVECVQQNI